LLDFAEDLEEVFDVLLDVLGAVAELDLDPLLEVFEEVCFDEDLEDFDVLLDELDALDELDLDPLLDFAEDLEEVFDVLLDALGALVELDLDHAVEELLDVPTSF